MDRLDWYRQMLVAAVEELAGRCATRSAARVHLTTTAQTLRAGGHVDRDTRRKLKQWTRRHGAKDDEGRLIHLVRTVVAAGDLLQSLEAQASSPTDPVLRNVARLACFLEVDDAVARTLAPGRRSYAEAAQRLLIPA